MKDLETTIFKATRKNFTDLKQLMLTALQEDPLGFSSTYDEYNNNSEYWWMSYLEPYISGERDVMFLAQNHNKIIGMAGILYNQNFRKKHVGLVAWVYVLKDYRRRGIAKLLVSHVIEEAKMKGSLEKLTLYVNETQEEALKLYEKFGFKASGKLRKDLKVEDKYLDTNIMELFLNS